VLLEGELDFALLLLPGNDAPLGLTYEPLMRTGPRVAAWSGHPLAGKKDLTLADLGRFPWLIPDYPPTHRAIVNAAFLNAGVPPPTGAIEVSTVVMFDAVMRETDLVTIVPSTLLTARDADLVALDADFNFPEEQVGLAFRQNSTLLPGARAIMQLIRDQCATLPGYVVPPNR